MNAASLFRKLIDPADPLQVDAFYQAYRPTIPLDRALLCLDCESIYEAEGVQKCPACGSMLAWAMARALNREPQPHQEGVA